MYAFLCELARLLRMSTLPSSFVTLGRRVAISASSDGPFFQCIVEETSEDVARRDRINRATELHELSGVSWARCYADLLDADLAAPQGAVGA